MTKVYFELPKNMNIDTYTAPMTSFVIRTEEAAVRGSSLFPVVSLTYMENASPKEPLIADDADATTSADCV